MDAKNPDQLTPAEKRQRDAEMALAYLRFEVNRALAYKAKHNAEEHNLCLALVTFKDGSTATLAAYSNETEIPPSLRLGLGLVPDVSKHGYAVFGCGGMAQYHTEPKLLNYLCADAKIREIALAGEPSETLPAKQEALAFYRAALFDQRQKAQRAARALRGPADIEHVTIVSEIDCCKTCTDYSIKRFRAIYGQDKLETIELHKSSGKKTPYTVVKISEA